MKNCCCLVCDTWSDNSYSVKNDYDKQFVAVNTIMAKVFSNSLGPFKGSQISNVIYDYDNDYISTFILEYNTPIYLVNYMGKNLTNLIQYE